MLKVREIIRLVEITPVPQMPPYIKGVINLRGKLVPVMDLRIRFDLAATESTEATCVVVAEVKSVSRETKHMGFIVDGVEEVLNLTEEDLQRTPDFGMELVNECLLGMANVKGNVIALLDIDKVAENGSLDKMNQLTAA